MKEDINFPTYCNIGPIRQAWLPWLFIFLFILAEVGAFSEIEKKQLVYFVVGAIDRIYRNHEGGSCEHQGKPN